MHNRWNHVAILGLLLCLIPLFLLASLFERARGRTALEEYKKQLAAKGEKLSLKELISAPQSKDKDENGAPTIHEASKRLNPKIIDIFPPKMKLLPSGRAVVGFREPYWLSDRTTNRWEELARALQTNEAAMEEIHQALNKPVLDDQLDYSKGPALPYPPPILSLRVAFQFGALCQLALRRDATREALADLTDELELLRLLEGNRILLCEIVRNSIASFAAADTWEALQRDDWNDTELASLQTSWEKPRFALPMAKSLEVERMFLLMLCDSLRQANPDALETVFGSSVGSSGATAIFKSLKAKGYAKLWRIAWLDQAEVASLESAQRCIEAARLGHTNRSFAAISPDLNRYITNQPDQKTFYNRLRYPDALDQSYFAKAVKRCFMTETERSIVLTAIALKRYALRHGKAPESLEALIPEFLSAVPTDFMDGKAVKYHLKSYGSFVLYSVGEDGRDDGGDSSESPASPPRHGIWNRKDFVWPAPATLPEVEQYRRTAAAQ